MKPFQNAVLSRLWELAGGDPTDCRSDWNETFEPAGLILLAPPRNYGYWCTPSNALTFAITGGDGVHYSLLAIGDEFTDFSPVVMTVPCCDTPNVVVGANLREFLALGCRYGYFGLEQLVYDRRGTLEELRLARFSPDSGPDERNLLRSLSSTFRLSPWSRPSQRLDELQTLFSSEQQLSPNVGDAT